MQIIKLATLFFSCKLIKPMRTKRIHQHCRTSARRSRMGALLAHLVRKATPWLISGCRKIKWDSGWPVNRKSRNVVSPPPPHVPDQAAVLDRCTYVQIQRSGRRRGVGLCVYNHPSLVLSQSRQTVLHRGQTLNVETKLSPNNHHLCCFPPPIELINSWNYFQGRYV